MSLSECLRLAICLCCFLPIAFCLLPIAFCLLLTAYCLLFFRLDSRSQSQFQVALADCQRTCQSAPRPFPPLALLLSDRVPDREWERSGRCCAEARRARCNGR